MSKTLTLVALVIVVTLSTLSTTGCKKKAGEATNDAVKDGGNAAEGTNDYLTQAREEAIKAAKEKIDLLDKKWQELQEKAVPATEEAKAELQKAKDQMAKILADAKTKLIEAKDAGLDTWQENVKPAIDTAMDKAQKLYDDTAAKFGSKKAE